jgi:hypothetical protein
VAHAAVPRCAQLEEAKFFYRAYHRGRARPPRAGRPRTPRSPAGPAPAPLALQAQGAPCGGAAAAPGPGPARAPSRAARRLDLAGAPSAPAAEELRCPRGTGAGDVRQQPAAGLLGGAVPGDGPAGSRVEGGWSTVEGAPAAAGAPSADAAGRDGTRARGAPTSTAGRGSAPAADSACGGAAQAPRASDPAAARAERCTGGADVEEPAPGGRPPDGAPLRVLGDEDAAGTPPDAAEGLPRAASLPLLAPALRRVVARFEARKAGYLSERGWRADPGSDRLEVLYEPPGPASEPRGGHAALPDPREPCSSGAQAHRAPGSALGGAGDSRERGAGARGPCSVSMAHRREAEAAQALACSDSACGAPPGPPAGGGTPDAARALRGCSLASWPTAEELCCPVPASSPGARRSSGSRAGPPPPAAQPALGLPAAADGAAPSAEGSSSPARSRAGAAARGAAGAAAPQRRARRRQAAPAAPGFLATQGRSGAGAPPAGRAAPAAGALELTPFHRVPTAPAGLLAPGSPCGGAAAGAAWLSAASPAPAGAAGQRAEWPDPLAWTAEAGVFRYRTLALSFNDAVPRALRPLVQVRCAQPFLICGFKSLRAANSSC